MVATVASMQSAETIPVAAFNAFDWLLFAIVAISTLLAYRRGFIRVLFSIGGLVLGIVVASWNYQALASLLTPLITDFGAAQVVAFVLLLIAVALVFGIVARLVRRTVMAVGLGIVDRLLGAAFGVVRGVLIGVALMLAIAAFVPRSPYVAQSRLTPYFLAGAHAISFVVPGPFQEQVQRGATFLLQQAPTLMRPHTLEQPPNLR